MQVSRKRTFSSNIQAQPIEFLDPTTLHDYIKHSAQSDYNGIRINDLEFDKNIVGTLNFQLIVDPLETSGDRHFLRVNVTSSSGTGYCYAYIIANGWRFGTRTKIDNTGEIYNFAGGSYDGRKGNVSVETGKTNFIADANNGTISFNGVSIVQKSTISIPAQTYYIGNNSFGFVTHLVNGAKLSEIDIMASPDITFRRAFYCKFYALRIFDMANNLLIDLRPYTDGSNVGVKNLMTGKTYFSSYGSGSFVFGTD